MPSAIDRLRAALAETSASPMVPPDVPRTLIDQVLELQRALGNAGAAHPPRDRMKEAVQSFQQTGVLETPGVARLVCFAGAERFAPSEPPIIENQLLFPKLLGTTDNFTGEPRVFRRCFRGLLHVYFVYDGDGSGTPGAGRENWSVLREYLHRRKYAIHANGVKPEWIDTLWSHENLLTEDPVSRYAARVLEGDATEINGVRSRLNIQDGTWLTRRIILAQLEAATRQSDESFCSKTERLLGLLDEYPQLENEGLALIVERYARQRAPFAHGALRDRSIRSWGNPTFNKHSADWSRVSSAAKQMISTWATLDIIRQFFEVLSDDRHTDKRRVDFWQRYHEQIQGMYFALGSAALNARDADSQRIRKQMGDHLLVLRRGGNTSNNAFIMLMGDVVAVEFGVKGNACYLYRKNDLPFTLRGELTPEDLRSAKHLDRLTHSDGYEKWEEKFASALARRGVHPSGYSMPVRNEWREQRAMRDTSPSEIPESEFSRQALHRFLKEHPFAVVDNTKKCGNISVHYNQQFGPIASTLRGWGFAYSEQRRFWWRKSWT